MQTYIETAEPAGSQTIARRFGLGVSPATIRNTMSELEDKGYLFHPHTSAGRIPTDRAYRVYVNAIMRLAPPSREAQHTLRAELLGSRNAVEEILRRAAQVLGRPDPGAGRGRGAGARRDGAGAAGAGAGELRAAAAGVQPAERRGPDHLRRGARPGAARRGAARSPGCSTSGSPGSRCSEIRATLPERLRDAGGTDGGRELLNIFIAEGEEIFDLSDERNAVVLGSAQMLAEQPEFASNARMRELLRLTEGRDLLQAGARAARRQTGLSITIGAENPDAAADRLHAGHRLLRGRRRSRA